jgi:fumarylpyruvate hydrolase
MAMKLAIPGWEIPTLAVAGSDERIAVRRVFCMGLNYHDHKKEMGITTDVPPFVFTKAAWHAVGCEADRVTDIQYPGKTTNYQWECELTAVIGKRGANIPAAKANEHIWGYAVGLDMTRRDLQLWCKDHALPWEIGKDVEQSGPVGTVVPAAKMGHPTSGALWLTCNGATKQKSDIGQMILDTPHIIEWLSAYYTLEPGDVIMTGTPGGIGPVKIGDVVEAGIGDLPVLKVRIVA